MKRLTLLLAGFVLIASSASAMTGDDRPITVGELPAASQQFIKSHFSGAEVSYAKVDGQMLDKDYTVVFADGQKVEFAKNGQWKEVESKVSGVPAAIVPKQIADEVAKKYKNRKITKIERDKRSYDVTLDNRLELKFDKKFKLVGIDD